MPHTDRVPAGALAYAGAAFAAFCWGGSFVAARALLHAGTGHVSLSPTLLAALRFLMAAAVLSPTAVTAAVRGRLNGRQVLRMILLGQLAFPVYFWLQYTGVARTNAGIASILVVGLVPLMTALLGALLGEERLGNASSLALLLGAAGTVVIVLQQPVGVSARSGFLLGALCLIANAIAFAIYGHLAKHWMKDIPASIMTGGSMLSGAAGILVLSLLGGDRWSDVGRLDGGQWLAVLYLAMVCAVLAYFAYNAALRRIGVTRAAVFLYVEPLVAVLLAIPLLGEHITPQTILGGALIALSIAGVNLRSSRRWRRIPLRLTEGR